jgi:3-oxoacyl-[acyl-carrier-protein] synthase II
MSTVVITGAGITVPGVDSPGDLLAESAIDTSADPLSGVKGREMRYKDRATKLAMLAARAALADADLADAHGHTTGVIVSSNYGNVDTVCHTVDTIAEQTYVGTSPILLPATSSNVIASWLAITHSLRGVNLTLCNGPTSGLDAVHWARLLISAGRVDRVLVAGVEPVNDVVNGLIATQPDAPERLLDGAAAIVVESAQSARERGVQAKAVIGRYARRADQGPAVTAVVEPAGWPIGLWCVAGDTKSDVDWAPAAARIQDLQSLIGDCSGALGVMQCVAAVAWMAQIDSAVLATAGLGDSGAQEASAALLLTPAGAGR